MDPITMLAAVTFGGIAVAASVGMFSLFCMGLMGQGPPDPLVKRGIRWVTRNFGYVAVKGALLLTNSFPPFRFKTKLQII